VFGNSMPIDDDGNGFVLHAFDVMDDDAPFPLGRVAELFKEHLVFQLVYCNKKVE